MYRPRTMSSRLLLHIIHGPGLSIAINHDVYSRQLLLLSLLEDVFRSLHRRDHVLRPVQLRFHAKWFHVYQLWPSSSTQSPDDCKACRMIDGRKFASTSSALTIDQDATCQGPSKGCPNVRQWHNSTFQVCRYWRWYFCRCCGSSSNAIIV